MTNRELILLTVCLIFGSLFVKFIFRQDDSDLIKQTKSNIHVKDAQFEYEFKIDQAPEPEIKYDYKYEKVNKDYTTDSYQNYDQQYAQISFDQLIDNNQKQPEKYIADQIKKAFVGYNIEQFEQLNEFVQLNNTLHGFHSQQVNLNVSQLVRKYAHLRDEIEKFLKSGQVDRTQCYQDMKNYNQTNKDIEYLKSDLVQLIINRDSLLEESKRIRDQIEIAKRDSTLPADFPMVQHYRQQLESLKNQKAALSRDLEQYDQEQVLIGQKEKEKDELKSTIQKLQLTLKEINKKYKTQEEYYENIQQKLNNLTDSNKDNHIQFLKNKLKLIDDQISDIHNTCELKKKLQDVGNKEEYQEYMSHREQFKDFILRLQSFNTSNLIIRQSHQEQELSQKIEKGDIKNSFSDILSYIQQYGDSVRPVVPCSEYSECIKTKSEYKCKSMCKINEIKKLRETYKTIVNGINTIKYQTFVSKKLSCGNIEELMERRTKISSQIAQITDDKQQKIQELEINKTLLFTDIKYRQSKIQELEEKISSLRFQVDQIDFYLKQHSSDSVDKQKRALYQIQINEIEEKLIQLTSGSRENYMTLQNLEQLLVRHNQNLNRIEQRIKDQINEINQRIYHNQINSQKLKKRCFNEQKKIQILQSIKLKMNQIKNELKDAKNDLSQDNNQIEQFRHNLYEIKAIIGDLYQANQRLNQLIQFPSSLDNQQETIQIKIEEQLILEEDVVLQDQNQDITCKQTRYGCCYDGIRAKVDENGSNCVQEDI